METGKVIKEKSILGQINDLSHKLVFMLVVPIVLSLVLMLIYAGKYHSSIKRMETIAELKSPVVNDIPGAAWDIISGRSNFENSNIYLKIHEVNDIIDTITNETDSDNRLSLIVAGRTMQTMENYVDRLKENIASEVPVITNETRYVELDRVSSRVDSMLNE